MAALSQLSYSPELELLSPVYRECLIVRRRLEPQVEAASAMGSLDGGGRRHVRTLVRIPDGFAPFQGHRGPGANLRPRMPTERRYEPSVIEPKWQAVWQRE